MRTEAILSLSFDSPFGPMRAVQFDEGPDPDGHMHTVIQCIEKDIGASAIGEAHALERLAVTLEAEHLLEKEMDAIIPPAPARFEQMWMKACEH